MNKPRPLATAAPDVCSDVWNSARLAHDRGRSVQQIAHALGLKPSQVRMRARTERWPPPPPPDWIAIRKTWESGLSASAVARQFDMSGSTVRKRCRREGWTRQRACGLDALRRAVGALEKALAQCDAADPASTARLAAALSMAAGRLSSAEKENLATGGVTPADADAAALESAARRNEIAVLFGRMKENTAADASRPCAPENQ